MEVHSFTFNPMQENTYILADASGECIIIDPGCLGPDEQELLSHHIRINKLNPVRLINTHCHIDHVAGNAFVARTFSLGPEIHHLESQILASTPEVGTYFGLQIEPSPEPSVFLTENETIRFGGIELEILHTPGHSPGSLCFYHRRTGKLIGGDVLFKSSIGRTDLPGGDFKTLVQSIRNQLFTLPDDTIVFPGHGEPTTIGHEKKHNPFVGLNSTYA